MPEGFAHSQETKTNQSLFLSFLNASGYVASNTYFMKPQHKLTTYVDPISQSNIQMDYILIHHAWKNAILDVSAGDRHSLDTDHNPLLATLRIKFRADASKSSRTHNLPYLLPPREDQIQSAQAQFIESAPNHSILDYETWMNHWIHAAHNCFSVKARTEYKTWITPETKELIQQRVLAAKTRNHTLWKTLDKAV